MSLNLSILSSQFINVRYILKTTQWYQVFNDFVSNKTTQFGSVISK